MKARTIVEKIWDSHVVAEKPGAPALLYIDLHLTHEVTSPQAFSTLRERGLKVRRPDLTIATMDHSTPTTSRDLPMLDTVGKVLESGKVTADLRPKGKPATTTEVGAAVSAAI